MKSFLVFLCLLFTPTALADRIFVNLIRTEDTTVMYYIKDPHVYGVVVFSVDERMGITKIECVKVIDIVTGQLWAQRYYSLDMSKSKEWVVTFVMRPGVET